MVKNFFFHLVSLWYCWVWFQFFAVTYDVCIDKAIDSADEQIIPSSTRGRLCQLSPESIWSCWGLPCFLIWQVVPDLSGVFLPWDLKLAISPRSSGSFYWKIGFCDCSLGAKEGSLLPDKSLLLNLSVAKAGKHIFFCKRKVRSELILIFPI